MAENFKNAWENQSSGDAGKLFADDAIYRETPFSEPMRGREMIIEYWKDVENLQKDIKFEYEILSADNEKGVAHWKAEFKRVKTDETVNLDGYLYCLSE